MAVSARAFLFDTARALAEAARIKALPAIPSETLRRSARMMVDVSRPGEASVYIPHYWAIYLHDGRGTAAPKGKYLVYYRDPKQDPRLRGGYPERRNQVRKLRLSKLEFNRLRQAGAIIVTKRVGPMKGEPFFSNTGGMAGFATQAQGIVRDEWRKFLTRELRGLGYPKPLVIKP